MFPSNFLSYYLCRSVFFFSATLTNFVPSYQSYNSTSPTGSYVSDDYFGFSHNKAKQKTMGTEHSIEMSVLSFLEDRETTISSLKKQDVLRKLFVKYNTALPSSAAVERLFSLAGVTLTPNRNRLSDATFESLVLGRANAHFSGH